MLRLGLGLGLILRVRILYLIPWEVKGEGDLLASAWLHLIPMYKLNDAFVQNRSYSSHTMELCHCGWNCANVHIDKSLQHAIH